VIETLAQEAPETPLVVFSGIGVIDDAMNAIRLGAWDFVTKPIADMRQLLHVVNKALERARLREESRRHQDHLEAEVAQRTRELAELNARLKRVVQSCRAIPVPTGLSQLTRQLLEEFAANIQVEGGSLYLVEDGKLVLKHTLDPGHATPCHALPLLDNSVLGIALNNRTPLMIEDIGADESTLPSGWTGYRDGALLAFPLLDSSGEPQGVVALHNKLVSPFTDHDREIGTVVASCGSEAIRAMRGAEALRASEMILRTFVNAIPEPALLIDRKEELLLCNQSLADRFGQGIGQLVGRNVFDLMPPEIARDRRCCVEEVFRTGKPIEFEDSRAGRHYLNHFYPVTDPLGETLWVAVFALDITDRTQFEKALRDSEEKYRELVENINDVIFSVDINGRVTYISPAVETVSGYRPEEIIGRYYRDFFLREDWPGLDERLKSILEGNTESREYQTRRKSGDLLWIKTSGRPTRKEGRIDGVQGSLSDITARKQAELELANRADELSIRNSLAGELAVRLSVESAVSTALDHLIQAVNPDLAMIFLREGKRLVPRKIVSQSGLAVDVESSHHRVGDCLCGLAVETARPVYSQDLHTDPRCTLRECKQAGLHSFAAFPLTSGGDIVGVLGLASTSTRDFDQHGSFLEALANEIAIGLKNALLYELAQADAMELRARLRLIQRAEEEKEMLMTQL
jgi:PAS domain S-box-containing protein